jgi:hypothetical protein
MELSQGRRKATTTLKSITVWTFCIYMIFMLGMALDLDAL